MAATGSQPREGNGSRRPLRPSNRAAQLVNFKPNRAEGNDARPRVTFYHRTIITLDDRLRSFDQVGIEIFSPRALSVSA